jgi:quercetin dioxygenase-like cupin family protein
MQIKTDLPISCNSRNCIRIIHGAENIKDRLGIDTSEGRAFPLILGQTMMAHALEMPAGLSIPEHAESEESMIYTLHGKWVLIADGQRYVMSPGSLHWIDEGASAGCEVPYDGPAIVLAFMRIKEISDHPSQSRVNTSNINIVTKRYDEGK